tara:strand:+ start:1261 stop:2553 length:1293 start_codon:yes stop_codon:yes gene_type:complete
MDRTYSTVILGAGIAGLAAGNQLAKRQQNCAIFEKNSSEGGLLDGFSVEGHRFDKAIHLSFATESEVREVFDQTKYYIHQPEAWCWYYDKWLKHPIHNNLYPLSAEDKVDLIKDFLQKESLKVNNYEDWLRNEYGNNISEKFNLPYTKKYWTLDANKLGLDWIGNRVRVANIEEILFGAVTEETPTYYYAKEMRYPQEGGYKSFLKPLISQCKIYKSHQAHNIDIKSKIITFNNGLKVHYKNLISTIPLPELIEILDEVPSEIKMLSKTLHATSVDLISVGFNKERIHNKLWFYIYDSDIFAARCHSPTIKSINNSPSGKSSLQFEIYSSYFSPLEKSVSDMKENTIYALKKMKIIKNLDEVEFIHHKHIKYANIIFDIGMERRRDEVLRWLSLTGIKSVGRFGEWDYLWSNQAFMSGISAATKIKDELN